eukprot:s35_g32.t1
MKIANPSCRFRLEQNGLTREKVISLQRSEQGLEAPDEYFVEADIYAKSGNEIKEEDLVWEEINGDLGSPKKNDDSSDSEVEMPGLNALMKSYGAMDSKTTTRGESAPKAAAKKRAAPESNGSKSKVPKLTPPVPKSSQPQDTTPAVKKVDIGTTKRKGRSSKVADKGGLNCDDDESNQKAQPLDSSSLTEQDQSVLECYNARLAEFSVIHPPLADAAYKSYLAEISTKVTLLINDVKTKRRSAMRRALKQQDPLYLALADVNESALKLQNMLKCS